MKPKIKKTDTGWQVDYTDFVINCDLLPNGKYRIYGNGLDFIWRDSSEFKLDDLVNNLDKKLNK